MVYEVVITGHRFRFDNFIEAATFATAIIENGEFSDYVKQSDGTYRDEWHKIEYASVRFIRNENPTGA